MEPLKAEVDAVVRVLREGWESPEAGAEAVIRALDLARTERTLYVIGVAARPAPFLYGPHGNQLEALRWAKGQGIDVVGLHVWSVPLFSPNRVLERHTTAAHDRLMSKKKDG